MTFGVLFSAAFLILMAWLRKETKDLDMSI